MRTSCPPAPGTHHDAASTTAKNQSPFASLTEPAKQRTAQTFTTTLPAFVDPGLEEFLIRNQVEISAIPIQSGSPLTTLLFGFGPAILIIAFYVWLYRRAAQQGGGMASALMGIGKSKARRYDQEAQTKVTFDDVAGIDEAENELVEIVDFLKDPHKYTRLGGTAPKGVLLVGSPGTGKTLLAKAVAGEAGVPFFSMSAAEFVEMIVGVGAARVRDLFNEARKHAPAIIFIDEIDSIAASTPGFSGADLKNLVNEAALLAARRDQKGVRQQDFLDALEKIVLGPERPLLLSREDRERIAYHESGHAILGLVVPGADPVHRVTIVPRGQALGVTYQRPQTERYNYPEQYLRAKIVGMLGGRAAEEIVYGTKTTGAESDIEQATNLARNMVTRWGMSDKVGMVQFAPRQNPHLGGAGFGAARPFSEDTARIIDSEVLRIIKESHEQARTLLGKRRVAAASSQDAARASIRC